ncbi:translation initiation factor IF-2 subunit alpha [Candidatus Woesearchaeota archaeon]|nr:translation initiation factor IF-2 subunit alpha [Candidatus Woesearchaeota archaeon]
MLYKKEGFPDDDELVLCTVTAVHGHSVFAKLDEYDKTGMIHISEVSPGRIRNIRDYVVEGKKIVCKVLKIDKKKEHIDLSLRRVNEGQKRKKTNEIKQEQKAEKIIEGIAKNLNIDVKELYDKIGNKVFEKYEYLHECFNDIIIGKTGLKKLGVEEELAEEVTEIVKERIKPPEVCIKGVLKLVSYDPDGIDIVKAALKKAVGENIDVTYRGAGDYNVIVNAPNYKEAEKILENSIDKVTRYMEKKKGIVSFRKEEKK